MPGRQYNATSSYRFGFNGKENDNEVKGTGNQQDYGARIYDTRLGRWLSTDPLQEKYPDLSPYCFVGNSPILFIDPDGKKIKIYGVERDAFLKKLNSGDIQFKINEKDELVLVDPKAKITGVYATTINNAINNEQTIDLKLIGESDEIFIDAFATGEVETKDLLGLDDNLFKTNILHIVVERIETKDYEKVKGTASNETFTESHNKALTKEEEFAKELYPEAKDVKYKSAGFDEKSKKLNADGSGTIDYVFDFGDVKQVYTQPISKDGSVKENIVKGTLDVKKAEPPKK